MGTPIAWEINLGWCEQNLILGTDNPNHEILMPENRVSQLRRQAAKILRRGNSFYRMPHQFQLSLQGVAILLFEVALDRGTDQPAQRQQHDT